MKNLQKLICIVAAAFLLIVTLQASERARHFRGTIVAYDPIYHTLKQPSFVENLEVTIADVGRQSGKQSFIKLIFEGFGTQQVEDDVLAGRTTFSLRAVRDTSCDEVHPHLRKVDSFEGSGSYRLNREHQTQSLDGILVLECYRVRVGK